MKEPIQITSTIDMESLVNTIIDIPKESDIIELIKKIDQRMESWQFTEVLCDYFNDETTKLKAGGIL